MSQSLAVLAAAAGPGLALVFLVSRHWPATRGRTGAQRSADPLPAPHAGFHDGPTLATAIGTIPMGWRYCPEDMATVAVYLHTDGSATCADDDCLTHIPATEEGAA